MKNKVSVLMTVYNSEEYVLDSIESILNQTYENFEFIIIDDLSDDKSNLIIENLKDKRIKFFKPNKKLGRTKALNYGLLKCNSKFIAIQDSDDISQKDRLENCMKIFDQNNEIGLISTNFNFINFSGKKENQKNDLKKFRQKLHSLKYINFIPHSSIIFRRDIFDENLFYDESFLYAQDYHLILKFFKYSKIYLFNEELVSIRRHSKNMSNNKLYERIRIKENLRLLTFSVKNFKLNFFELINIGINIIKNILKFSYFWIFK